MAELNERQKYELREILWILKRCFGRDVVIDEQHVRQRATGSVISFYYSEMKRLRMI